MFNPELLNKKHDRSSPPKQQQQQQQQIRATTFNAAEFDKKYKHKVCPHNFMEQHGQHQDFLLLQEATGRGILAIACSAGMEVISCDRGPAIAYDPKRFVPEGTEWTAMIPAESGTNRGLGQQFLDRRTGLRVNVVNVHAGHNTSSCSKTIAKAGICALQTSWGTSDVDKDDAVTITGGDFNELTTLLDTTTVGQGCDTTRQTHTMGANDKIGARGTRVSKATSKAVGNFGSDHDAVELTVNLTAGGGAVSTAAAGGDDEPKPDPKPKPEPKPKPKPEPRPKPEAKRRRNDRGGKGKRQDTSSTSVMKEKCVCSVRCVRWRVKDARVVAVNDAGVWSQARVTRMVGRTYTLKWEGEDIYQSIAMEDVYVECPEHTCAGEAVVREGLGPGVAVSALYIQDKHRCALLSLRPALFLYQGTRTFHPVLTLGLCFAGTWEGWSHVPSAISRERSASLWSGQRMRAQISCSHTKLRKHGFSDV